VASAANQAASSAGPADRPGAEGGAPLQRGPAPTGGPPAWAALAAWLGRHEAAGLLLVAPLAVALATLGAASQPEATGAEDLPALAPIRALVHWDAGWYGAISRDGYFYRPGEQSSVAFFPLYPLSIAGLSALGLNRWVAAVALSLLFGLGAVLLFGAWARRLDPASAPTATWLLVLYPFAIYLYGIPYSDGLFLLCAVGAFLALESDRPLLAAVLGALASACRPVAPALMVGLLARSVERRWRLGLPVMRADLLPGLCVLGLLAWMGYLQVRFGDALAYVHVQSAPGWAQPPGWETWLKVTWFQTMFPRVAPLVALRLGGHALLALGALALVVPTFRRLGWGYGLFTLLMVGVPVLSSKDFQGLGRYAMAAFPLFLTGALLLRSAPRVRVALLVGSGVALVFCAVAFGAGGYVA
jgi:hypothetical protein